MRLLLDWYWSPDFWVLGLTADLCRGMASLWLGLGPLHVGVSLERFREYG
ncbi:MAG: hypothetical protein JRD89_08835 [Deltaproteobacteria bacterium]|nr:hypothetical protein [Deltaproteobacteria bacterium]